MCGNTRCKHYNRISAKFDSRSEDKKPVLTTLELPFAYVEHGESKSALVKVVLCEKCLNKLMWKRRQDRESKSDPDPLPGSEQPAIKQEETERVVPGNEDTDLGRESSRTLRADKTRGMRIDRWDRERDIDREKPVHNRRSRSRSPRSHRRPHGSKRRPS